MLSLFCVCQRFGAAPSSCAHQAFCWAWSQSACPRLAKSRTIKNSCTLSLTMMTLYSCSYSFSLFFILFFIIFSLFSFFLDRETKWSSGGLPGSRCAWAPSRGSRKWSRAWPPWTDDTVAHWSPDPNLGTVHAVGRAIPIMELWPKFLCSSWCGRECLSAGKDFYFTWLETFLKLLFKKPKGNATKQVKQWGSNSWTPRKSFKTTAKILVRGSRKKSTKRYHGVENFW